MAAHPARSDAVVAAALVVLSQIETWTTSAPFEEQVGMAALALIACGGLAWRRARPDLAALVVMSAMVAGTVLLPSLDALWPVAAMPLSLYSAGRHAGPRAAVTALALGVLFDVTLDFDETSSSVGEFLLNFLFILVTLVAVPWAAGYALRVRARETERRAIAAVADERRRVAREIHDVVGHALGIIVVQAGAERATLPTDAAQSTRDALGVIERTGRNALVEMRRLVDVMNTTDAGADPRSPLPGLGQIEELLSSLEAAGLPTRLHVEGEPVTLPVGLDLSAFRVVQEALTNALRHAAPARADVTLRYLPWALEIDVVDDGERPAKPNSSPGHGLTGMRERVALFGGSVRSGPRPEGGYELHVRLPVERAT
jgi:signal transduction histidine kinase